MRICLLLWVPLFCLLQSSAANAASYRESAQSGFGNSLDITLTIPEYLHILPRTQTDGWVFYQDFLQSASQNVCVYSNGSSRYRIRFLGDAGSEQDFVASNGEKTRVYTVSYDDGSREETVVLPGSISYHYIRRDNRFQCAGGVNSRVTIRMDDKDSVHDPSAAYVAILTMQIASE